MRKGVTLIEYMIVVAIVGILIGLIIPAYSVIQNRANLNSYIGSEVTIKINNKKGVVTGTTCEGKYKVRFMNGDKVDVQEFSEFELVIDNNKVINKVKKIE